MKKTQQSNKRAIEELEAFSTAQEEQNDFKEQLRILRGMKSNLILLESLLLKINSERIFALGIKEQLEFINEDILIIENYFLTT